MYRLPTQLPARIRAGLLAGLLMLSACAQAAPTPVSVEVTRQVPVEATRIVEVTVPALTQPAPASRELTVLAGAGQETDVLSAFLPSVIRVRAGDTVSWKIESDEIHTVTFNPPPAALQPVVPVPGGGPTDFMIPPETAFPTRLPGAPVEVFDGKVFASSGIMSRLPDGPDAPPNDTFSLTFSEPGSYTYLCLFHPYMKGTVVVEPALTSEVPEQAEIDAQIQAELGELMGLLQAAKETSQISQSAAGADGTTLWFVNAGATVGNPAAATYSFGPKDLTIKPGDTVIWNSDEFHTVTFVPAPPQPEFVVPVPQPAGPPYLTINPDVFFQVKPAAVYDPAQYFNSGALGPGLPNGTSFSLTFDAPGTYEYICAVHGEMGMKGTITVAP